MLSTSSWERSAISKSVWVIKIELEITANQSVEIKKKWIGLLRNVNTSKIDTEESNGGNLYWFISWYSLEEILHDELTESDTSGSPTLGWRRNCCWTVFYLLRSNPRCPESIWGQLGHTQARQVYRNVAPRLHRQLREQDESRAP